MNFMKGRRVATVPKLICDETAHFVLVHELCE